MEVDSIHISSSGAQVLFKQLDVILQIHCAYRNTRSERKIYDHLYFVSRSPMLISLIIAVRSPPFIIMRAKHSPSPPRRYISQKPDKHSRSTPRGIFNMPASYQ